MTATNQQSEAELAFADVPIEAVRSYWDARPCNVRHSNKAVGTREYFDEVEHRKYFVESHIPPFANFQQWKGKRVLELGCGIGTDTVNFARAGAQVTAVDLSRESLALAQTRVDVFGLGDRVNFQWADIEKLSDFIPVERYDLVYSFGVIHHTPHPDRAIANVKKYLGRDSEFRLMMYSKASYKLFWIMKEEGVWDMGRIDELIARNSEAQTGCPVTYTYTYGELRALLADFDVFSLEKAHIFTWDIDSYVKYEYEKDAAWSGVSDEQLRELEKELGWHMLAKARLKF